MKRDRRAYFATNELDRGETDSLRRRHLDGY